ncbi:hypothetical protein BsWGS_20425 [Bradybaena similaris]
MISRQERHTEAAYCWLLGFLLFQTCACRHIYETQRSKCHSADGSYQHGQVYTRESSAVCLRYQCENGHENLIDTRCRDEKGQCHLIGQTVEHAQCVQRTCTMNGGYVSMKITTRECAFKDQCVKVNQVVTDGCVSYRCTQVVLGEDKFRLGMELEGAGCPHPDNRSCVVLGQTIKCGSLMCDLRDNLIGFYPVKSVCQDQETGRCYDVGASWQTKECVTWRCEAGLSGSNNYATSIVPVSRGCPDSDGKCHEPDGVSLFPMTVQGRLRQCVCQQVENNMVQYSCLAGDIATHR